MGTDGSSLSGRRPGHPVATMLAENEQARRLTAELRRASTMQSGAALVAIGAIVSELGDIERHYRRAEDQLFPFLEAHRGSGTSGIMWSAHDAARAMLRALPPIVRSGDALRARRGAEMLAARIEEVARIEDEVVLPMSLDSLTDEEWAQIRGGESAIGYSWVPEPPEWSPDGG